MNFKLNFESFDGEHTEKDLRLCAFGGRKRYEGYGVAVEHIEKKYQCGLIEYRLLVKNISDIEIKVSKAWPFYAYLGGHDLVMQYFSSSWAKEYGLIEEKIKAFCLENEKGRSSNGYYPQMFFKDNEGYVAAVCIAWSGNWKFEITCANEIFYAAAGISDSNFYKIIKPGEVFDSYRVLAVFPEEKSLDSISKAFALWHREYNSPKNREALNLPVEWNHWWPHDDFLVNEEMFKKNADAAAEIGCEICVLDAGWFGSGGGWYNVRGDWHKVNTQRFPSGIRALSDYVHDKGLKFGMWCEIEALGNESETAASNPHFAAKRDGEPLGYVCLGCQDAWNWAFSTLEHLIFDYNVDWIKIDFNLDPGYGCNRTDHGHGEGDGLYEHYRGLYRLADAIRSKYPHVILEACSSGGLRIDHEILRHFDFHHLSDTDETVHKMRFYHHNLTVLPPEALLHWAWSDALVHEDGSSAFPPFTPWDPKYERYEIDTHIRIGMLGVFGYSHRFNLFDDKTKSIFKHHTSVYKKNKKYIKHGLVLRLEPQEYVKDIPLFAVQYLLQEEQSSMCFVFCRDSSKFVLKPKNLKDEVIYNVYDYDKGTTSLIKGGRLMEKGIDLGVLRNFESRMIEIRANLEEGTN